MQLKIKNIYFIGIGGVGMSGIAEVLRNLGYEISGSDKSSNDTTKKLADIGCKIYLGHNKNNIKNAQIIVISSAIDAQNPEIIAAKGQGIPIISRAEMLAELMRFRYGIAVAGTHGKTTVTSLIAHILAQAGLDPTYIIGGILNNSGNNAKLGTGEYLVAEADESDSSFLHLKPTLAVITNIDEDHMEAYQYSKSNLEQAFLGFIANLPIDGACIICIDDIGIKNIKASISRTAITYGFDTNADIIATDFSQNANQTTYKAYIRKDNISFAIKTNLLGKHNVQNTLGAIAIALYLDIDIKVIQQALASFAGVNRRLQYYGELKIANKKILYFDDYGHHPSEILAVLSALRTSYNKPIVAIFQPHRYSRVNHLFKSFIEVLATIDKLILLDIYPAGEAPIRGISQSTIIDAIHKYNGSKVFVANMSNAVDKLVDIVDDNDIVITLGAGNIYKLVDKIKTYV